MSINVLIIEDEFTIALDIEVRLKKMGFGVVGIADNADKAIRLADEEAPDIILLDIFLEGSKDGVEIAKQINNELSIPFIFLTANADEATFKNALNVLPYGYILKPFKDIDLKHAIDLALLKFKSDLEKRKKIEFAQSILATALEKQNNENLFIKEKNIVHKIEMNTIFWLEALDNYTCIYTTTKRYTIHSFLKDVLNNLPIGKFVRTHRSYAVAQDKIKSIREDKVILVDETEISLSRTYKNAIVDQLNIL